MERRLVCCSKKISSVFKHQIPVVICDNNTTHIIIKLYHSCQLTPLEFRSASASALEGSVDESPVVVGTSCSMTTEVTRKHGGKYGSIAFVVRRPGNPHILLYCFVICSSFKPIIFDAFFVNDLG